MRKKMVFLVLIVLIALVPAGSARADDLEPAPDGEEVSTLTTNVAGESFLLTSKLRWWWHVFNFDTQGQSKVDLYGGPNLRADAWTVLIQNNNVKESTFTNPCRANPSCTSKTKGYYVGYRGDTWENDAHTKIYWSNGQVSEYWLPVSHHFAP